MYVVMEKKDGFISADDTVETRSLDGLKAKQIGINGGVRLGTIKILDFCLQTKFSEKGKVLIKFIPYKTMLTSNLWPDRFEYENGIKHFPYSFFTNEVDEAIFYVDNFDYKCINGMGENLYCIVRKECCGSDIEFIDIEKLKLISIGNKLFI